MTKPTIQQVDALLPQTQCGLCDYAGCKPYATAIIEQNETLDRCPPGGVETLSALGQLLNQNITALVPEMTKKAKPTLIAVIRENECIGCTKCIQACPVDAIIGAGKQMHTILASECTGCELCIAPCPVDCIDLVPIPESTATAKKQQANYFRSRFKQRQTRLQRDQNQRQRKHQQAKLKPAQHSHQQTIAARQAEIKQAIARRRAKQLAKTGDNSWILSSLFLISMEYASREFHYAAFNHALAEVDKKYVISQKEHLTEYDWTTLLAKKLINNGNPLLIANFDQLAKWGSGKFLHTMNAPNIDSGILTFESTHPKWSYIKLNEQSNVTSCAKNVISNIATVGIYD